MLHLPLQKDGSQEQAKLVDEWTDYEHEVIEKYMLPEGMELTEENYAEFKADLRERTLNVLHGNKFRANVGGTTQTQ